MKIEKITDNKIRIIVNLDDLAKKNIDLHTLMSNSIESQSLFMDMLDEAEKKVGFSTKNCKTFIEALASSDGHFIFTITKEDKPVDTYKKKSVRIKRKTAKINSTTGIYEFGNFEEFCTFCTYINNSNFKNFKNFAKDFSLYLYNNTYYLIVSNFNLNNPNLKGFYALFTEFARPVINPESFECKLTEYGKPIMKRNAISRCIKYFS